MANRSLVEPMKKMAGVSALVVVAVVTGAVLVKGGTPVYVTAPGASGHEIFVAPDGKPTNDGSKDRPFDIVTLFGTPKLVQPGDTVWLRGGTYKVAVTSKLVGEPDAPIVVRQYPGERAILDAASRRESPLTVHGSDTWYWGFEVTDSDPTRVTANPTYTDGVRATSVSVFGPRTRFINMVVHDGQQGFGFWTAAVDAELYGNIIYNVGFEAVDRGHGHSVYVQNEQGTKRIVDNILFNGHSFGIHAYTENGSIDNIHLEGNTAFGHGLLSREGPKVNFLYRSKNTAPQNVTLIDNYSYYSAEQSGRAADLSTPVPLSKGCTNAVLRGNYFAAPAMALAITCQSIKEIAGNTFYGNIFALDKSVYSRNEYLTEKPSGTHVFVRPNLYEKGRGHITVFNWDREPDVRADLSFVGLEPGDYYEIRDVQDYFGPPLVVARYWPWRRASIPMTGARIAPPVGDVVKPPRHTDPEFGAFVVVKTHAPN